MTLAERIIFYTTFFIVAAIDGFPRIALRKQRMFNSEEIRVLRPDLRGLKVKYNAILLLGGPIYIILMIAVGLQFERPDFNAFFLFFAGLFFFGLFDGIFALITGVFPVTGRWDWDRFYYDYDERFLWMARLQVTLAAIGTFVCLAVYFFYS